MFNLKSLFLGTILFLSICTTFSQNVIRCYTDEVHQQLLQQHPELESNEQFEQWMQQQILQNQASAIIGGVYYIPVVVHVIHNGEAVGTGSNVSFAAIQSQIDVLNEDFRRIFGSNGWNTHPDGADTQIEFCLAQRRPDGSAFPAGEPGVNRINRTTAGFTAPPYSQTYIDATVKPYTYNNNVPTATRGWDPAKYMNIWLANLSGGLLGYAQFPQSPLGGMSCGNQTAGTDGVVFLYSSIGKSSVTGFTGAYNEGRTATHEIGHWLGLRHIWGDGGCTVDDYCNDTPEAGAANYGCPTGTNSCTAAPDAGVDMIENYMDYTDDLCMNIFTNDQKMRMRTVLENSPLRASLINSDACTPPLAVDASVVDIINPKGDNCIGSITPSVTLKNRGSGALTSATISYKIDNGAPTTFAWTGNLASGATANVTLPAFTTTAGQHMFKAYSTLPNGAADQATAFDTSGISFVVSTGISAPYTETFDGGTFPPDVRWVVENPTNDCYEWVGASATSITGVFNNNAAQFPGFGNGTGQTENLVTPIFTLPCNATAASLQFDVAYRRRNTTTTNYERLYVEISENCGTTWTPVYDKTGTTLQVITTTLSTYYTPVGTTDWRTETINLLPFVTTTSKNVKFRFRAVAANGNNIYIDNLKFNATTPGEIAVTQTSTNILDEGYSNVGSVSAGGSSIVTYTITNTGTSNLTLTGPISVTGTGFSLGSTFGTTTVPAGGTTTFSVIFSPTASANYTGNVSFGTNDCDESTFNFQINGTGVTNPPIAGFTPSATVICAGQTVTFTNTSTNATSYSWNFGTGASPSTSTATTPTVTFNNIGTYTVSLTATNSFGNNVQTQTNVITVLDGTGVSLPISEGFTTTTFPPTNWSIVNTNNSPTTWVRSTAAGNTPTTGNSMVFDNFNYNDSDDDQVKLPGANLNGYSTAQLQFDVAYAPYNATSFDGLEVLVSTNCGASWTSIYMKSNTTLATAAATTSAFTPTASQWRTETVSLTPYVGNSKVILSFKNLSGYGNKLYVDNINLTGVALSVPPVASFTPSATTICAGQSVTFSNTSTGNPTSYSWSFPSGNPTTSTATSPTVTFAAAGTYTVSLVATNTNGSNTATQTIVVNANPTVTASNQTICSGSTATLQAAGTPSGGTYTWSPSGSTSSITVTPTATTTYTVTYTANGCSATQTSVVTVNPLPTVTSTSATICAGSSATLTATPSTTGGTYLWTPGGQTTQSISVNPTTNTTYSIVYSLNGCNSTPASAQVVVNQLPTVTVNSTTICAGNSATLTATPSTTGGTYSWSNNASTQTITVTPTTTVNYVVTYTAAGCTGVSATGTITVNQNPTVSVSSQTICSGNSATLQATGSPAGGTYSWSPSGSGSSITVTPNSTTTYTVSYLQNGCNASQTSIVTVNPLPTVTVSGSSICTGGTATLTATPSATGGTYIWTPGGQTTQTISVNPSTNTTYTVAYSLNGCNSSPASAQVTVVQPPTVNVNSITLCEGNTATLTATPSDAGGTYSWSNAANTQSITVTPTSTSSYVVTYTISGCAPATASGTVTVSPSPMVNLGADTTICTVDFPYTLTASVSGTNNQFTWNTGGQTQSITITTGGSYTVNVTNSSGCSSSDVIQIISDPCASMEQLNEWAVKVYPNPSSEIVTIESNEILEHIYLFDSNGKLVYSSNVLGNTFSFDVSKLVTGVYELNLVNANSVVWKKLIKH